MEMNISNESPIRQDNDLNVAIQESMTASLKPCALQDAMETAVKESTAMAITILETVDLAHAVQESYTMQNSLWHRHLLPEFFSSELDVRTPHLQQCSKLPARQHHQQSNNSGCII
jgi:hypothetical protein